MNSQQKKVLFLCYLMASSLVITMARRVKVTKKMANEIAEDFMKSFKRDLDRAQARAPANPNNDLDEEDTGRVFFLIPFLPKLAILLVKVAIKVAPLIVKAAVAVKAKAVAVAAAGLAKVSTGAALKATAISVGKKILADVATNAVIDVVSNVVTSAASPPAPEPSVNKLRRQHKLNLIDLYKEKSEECHCTNRKHCSCCITPDEFETGCFNVTLIETLWKDNSAIKLGAFYGGKEIMTRTMEVGQPQQKCQMLSEPFNTVNMCVSTFAREFMGKHIVQCFSLYFNKAGLTKCLVQTEDGKIWFKRKE